MTVVDEAHVLLRMGHVIVIPDGWVQPAMKVAHLTIIIEVFDEIILRIHFPCPQISLQSS